MIENKIEEAAKDYASKRPIIINCDARIGFEAGINWFLGNLFHPSDEEPKVGKEYLLKASFFNDEGDSFDAYVTSTFGVDGWKEDFFPRGYDFEVEEWACIDDLLKGGK